MFSGYLLRCAQVDVTFQRRLMHFMISLRSRSSSCLTEPDIWISSLWLFLVYQSYTYLFFIIGLLNLPSNNVKKLATDLKRYKIIQ